jgi:hypothetical protein
VLVQPARHNRNVIFSGRAWKTLCVGKRHSEG